MHNNSLLLGGGYDDLRLRIEGCGGAEKFWSFGPKLPNRPPYSGANRPRHRSLTLFLRLLTFCSDPAQSLSVMFFHSFL